MVTPLFASYIKKWRWLKKKSMWVFEVRDPHHSVFRNLLLIYLAKVGPQPLTDKNDSFATESVNGIPPEEIATFHTFFLLMSSTSELVSLLSLFVLYSNCNRRKFSLVRDFVGWVEWVFCKLLRGGKSVMFGLKDWATAETVSVVFWRACVVHVYRLKILAHAFGRCLKWTLQIVKDYKLLCIDCGNWWSMVSVK